MQAFTTLTGTAIPFGMKNVDTDVIIPAQYLKTVSRTGLRKVAFPAIRKEADNVFDTPRNKGAAILIAGDNFGCGSSREHAPWALLDFGIRCVISTSFADIFYNNCFKNGILPIKVTKQQLRELMDDAAKGSNAVLEIDLESQTIGRPNGESVAFEIDPHRKHCLLNGLDDIGLTLQRESGISEFEEKRKLSQPWA